MPIMAVQDQNDVRGSTRVLANTAKRYINHLPADDRHIPAMNGVFRLLKLYRASKLQGYEYQPRMDRGPDAVYMRPATSRHVGDLREALDLALADAANGRPHETTIDAIQNALKGLAAKQAPNDQDERQTVTIFLDSLLLHLNPAE